MTSNLSDRISALSDLRVVEFLQYFNQSLLDGVVGDLEPLFADIPPSIREIPGFDRIKRLYLEEEEIQLDEAESIAVSRQILQALAQNPRLSPLLEKALDTYADREGGTAKNILAVGLTASMMLLAGNMRSFEVEAFGVKLSVGNEGVNQEMVEFTKALVNPLANLPAKGK
ncbi:MAG: hypothetical protein HC865_16825 [Cyanobacteria bacterium RU_5_0]|nr:hypothetical protein [Cyanobacteria bacterium RU_5_0]